jgi:serine/threonine protein kinase
MGNTTVRQTPAGQNLDQDLRLFMQVDLPKFVTHSKIGNGKFMKTYLMRIESTQVVVKVYMKYPEEDVLIPAKALTNLWNTIPPTKYPNLMPYQMWIRSTPKSKALLSPVYLIRQFFNANLYDRLSTRPFLNELEKYWIIYQLLKCLEICHEHGVVHGDIKPENIMCTTSNWIVLTDFSPFKPVMLPDDDLTDFKYFFDAMARDRCYIAQERFFRKDRWSGASDGKSISSAKKPPMSLNKPSDIKPRLMASMDVFSVGCIMAEIMMDGTPLFDLPGMLQYVSSPLETLGSTGTFSVPSTPLPQSSSPNPASGSTGSGSTTEEISAKQLMARIRHPQLKTVIASMTRKDADKRLSASDYLKILQGKISVEQLSTETENVNSPKAKYVIPDFFESCIYPLFLKLHWNGVTPDDRVMIVCETFGDIVQHICGFKDTDGARFFSAAKTDAPLVLASLLSLENRSHEVLLPAVGLEVRSESKSGKSRSEAEQRALRDAKWPTSGNSSSRVKVSEDSVLLLSAKDRRELTAGELLQLAKAQLHDLEILQRSEPHWENEFLDQPPLQQQSVNKQSQLQEALVETLDLLQQHLSAGQNVNSSNTSPSTGPKYPFSFFAPPISADKSSDGDVTNNDSSRRQFEGVVLVIDIICANYRHLKLLPSRALSVLLLGRLGVLAPDAVILQRIVPVLLIATEDAAPTVRVLALRALTGLTALVRHIEPIEVGFFPQYVFHALSRLSKDQELLVKLAFAQCLGSIACTAKRFLVLGHRLHADKILRELNNNSNSNTAVDTQTDGQNLGQMNIVVDFPYDSKLEQLKEQVSRWIRDLVMDPGSIGFGLSAMHSHPTVSGTMSNAGGSVAHGSLQSSPETSVKKVLLAHVLELSEFFGQESTMDKLLTQLLTFLNDQDSELRELFCRQIAMLGMHLGLSVTSEYIVPCLENVLYDVEEKVAVAAVEALTSLVAANLVAQYWLLDFCHKATALLLHPSIGLRTAGIQFFSQTAKMLGTLDTCVLLLPILKPFFTAEVGRCVSVNISSFKSSTSRTGSESEGQEGATLSHLNSSGASAGNKSMDGEADGCNPVAAFALASSVQNETHLRMALRPPLQMHSLITGLRSHLMIFQQNSSGGSSNSDSTAPAEADQDKEEVHKLQLMQTYLSHTAREVYTKSLRWRHAASPHIQQLFPFTSTNSPPRTGSSARRTTFSGAGETSSAAASASGSLPPSKSSKSLSTLQWSVTHSALLDGQYHSANNNSNNNSNIAPVLALAVPTMRAGMSIGEDLRKQNIYLDHDEERNGRKLRMLFLAYPILNTNANNSLGPNAANNTSASGGEVESYYEHYYDNPMDGNDPNASVNNTNNTNSSSSSGGNNNSKRSHYYHSAFSNDSVSLLRRLRALQVPPVCIDLGSSLASPEELRLLQDTNTLLSLGVFSAVAGTSSVGAAGGAVAGGNSAVNMTTALQLNNINLDALDAASQQQLQQQLQLQVALYNLNNSAAASNNAGAAAAMNSANMGGGMLGNANYAGSGPAMGAGSASAGDGTISAGASAASNAAGGNLGNTNAVGGAAVVNSGMISGRREREGVLVMTLREHAAAVNRIAVSSDMSYFCSASSDATVKVWQTRLLDRAAFPRSTGSYAGHKSAVVDAVAIEQSHSVCSASRDGSVHVWRVDMSLSNSNNTSNSMATGTGVNTHGSYIHTADGTKDTALTTTSHIHGNANSLATNGSNTSSVIAGNANINSSNATSANNDIHFLHPNASYAYASVRGASLLRVLNPDEGAVSCVQHFHSDVASVVLFASQRGGVHAWDLRMSREAFSLALRPELGYLTALTVGPDKHWVGAGTAKGVVALWDVRFNVLSAAWRHSSGSAIQRLACCKAPRSVVPGLGYTEGAFLFCAAGNNEAAIFGLPEGGECAKCFRSVPMNESRGPVLPLPQLTPLHLSNLYNPHLLAQPYHAQHNSAHPSHVVRAMLGRVSATNPSHLVTAGSDRCIRFWDFQQPSQCFTIAGSEPTQPRAQFRVVKTEAASNNSTGSSYGGNAGGGGASTGGDAGNVNGANLNPFALPTTSTTNKLLVCYTSALPSPDKILQSQLPVRENRGLSVPSVNCRDGILDLKDIELPQRLLVSSARDGEIKLWKVLL